MTRLASVEWRGDQYIVTSYSQTPPGFWRMNGQFKLLPCTTDVDVLGEAILGALDGSNRVPLLDMEASTEAFAPVLAALGLKNFGQYMKDCVSVSVEIGPDALVRITPMRNGGVREGFVEILDSVRVVDDSSPESLGAGVVAAMHASK